MSINEIKAKTRKVMSEWKDVFGFAPDTAANKLYDARLDWIIELTDCLEIWSKKGVFLTEGELLLARANLGAVTEGWLKFFYCVYYEDYIKNPKKDTKGNIREPNELSFELLKQSSRTILWETNDDWDLWVGSVQSKRNAIHAFNDKEIGTPILFMEDLDKLMEFIKLICGRLPDIEDHPKYNS
ncbi:hypothetical protein K2F43_08240 [Clostridium estertheticum]|uniref:hypothetical protein n=1 Tax=Clostridium estertheticum TaxID=238834 RepID=UPI001C6F2E74|nr:hypothetical protein [Clostridium estertheticum]MBW9171198.1 hypothetical protein [Clostridium estertheticum]WLC73943.1 hypothetical protein KTC99_14295 [Clostridium estertheticum]